MATERGGAVQGTDRDNGGNRKRDSTAAVTRLKRLEWLPPHLPSISCTAAVCLVPFSGQPVELRQGRGVLHSSRGRHRLGGPYGNKHLMKDVLLFAPECVWCD